MRISDWSSDVCSSDLVGRGLAILDKGPDRRIEIEVNQRAPEEGESGRFGPAIGARVDGVAGGGIVGIMERCDQKSPVGRPGDFPIYVKGRAWCGGRLEAKSGGEGKSVSGRVSHGGGQE